MRYELSDSEWNVIRMMLPNKPHLTIVRSDRAAVVARLRARVPSCLPSCRRLGP
jgi:transposase